MSFENLKRKSKNSLERLTAELNKLSSNSNKDDRFWSPTVDKAGNGTATIRFLPPVGDEVAPFVRVYSHAFRGEGGWYIENSLTTIGLEDPVAQMNSELWNSGGEEGKKIVQGEGKDKPGTKRKMEYIANIYVVDDPAAPENNGKVFLYKFGKKIMDKLNDASIPAFPDEKPFDPFNFWEGANFKLRIRRVDGYRNYDKSSFDECAPLDEDDAVLEAIYKKQYPLSEFTDPKNFKTYEQLKERLDIVMGRKKSSSTASKAKNEEAPRKEKSSTDDELERLLSGDTEESVVDDVDAKFQSLFEDDD